MFGSGSFHQQEKSSENLDFNCFVILEVFLKCVISKKLRKENLFSVGIVEATDEKSRIQIRKPLYGSKDPDPSKNFTIWNTGIKPPNSFHNVH